MGLKNIWLQNKCCMNICCLKIFWVWKMFGSDIFLGSQKIPGAENFWVLKNVKNVGPNKFLVWKMFESEKYRSEICLQSHKIVGLTNFECDKFLVPKNFWVWQNFMSKKFDVRCGKLWVWKNIGSQSIFWC